VKNVKKLASGDLLVETFTSAQIRDLLKLRKFHTFDVEVSIPVSMNSCKGVITHRELIDMDAESIVECMGPQGIIEARHITRFVNGTRVKTATVVLTFAGTALPEKVKVGYEPTYVRAYIPNPLRCFKCQLFGHHGNACRSTKIFCGRCAGEGHKVEDCTAPTEKCRNCEGAHSTTSRDCPVWKVEKEVCAVKATEGISYYDARKKVKAVSDTPKPNVSFASAVATKPVMCTIGIQTDPAPSSAGSSNTTPTPRNNTATTTNSNTTTTSTTTTTTTNYSKALSTSSTKPKNDKRDKLNLTTLQKNTPHAIVNPEPSRERRGRRSVSSRDRSASRSLSSSSRELVIDEQMEISTGKDQKRSPGSCSPDNRKQHKKTKHNGHTHPS